MGLGSQSKNFDGRIIKVSAFTPSSVASAASAFDFSDDEKMSMNDLLRYLQF